MAAGTGGILYAVEGAVHGGLNAKGICTTVIGVQLINKQACPALQSNVLAHGHGSVAAGVGLVGTVNYYRRIIGLLLVQLAAAGNIQSTMIDADIVVLNKTGIKAVHIQGDLPAILDLDLRISGRALQQSHSVAILGRGQSRAQAGITHTVNLSHSGVGVDHDLAVLILLHAGLDIGADVPSRTASRLEGAAGDVDAGLGAGSNLAQTQLAGKGAAFDVQRRILCNICASRRVVAAVLNLTADHTVALYGNSNTLAVAIAGPIIEIKGNLAVGGKQGAVLNHHIAAVVAGHILTVAPGAVHRHIIQSQIAVVLEQDFGRIGARLDGTIFKCHRGALQQLKAIGLRSGRPHRGINDGVGKAVQVNGKGSATGTLNLDTAAFGSPQQVNGLTICHSVHRLG